MAWRLTVTFSNDMHAYFFVVVITITVFTHDARNTKFTRGCSCNRTMRLQQPIESFTFVDRRRRIVADPERDEGDATPPPANIGSSSLNGGH